MPRADPDTDRDAWVPPERRPRRVAAVLGLAALASLAFLISLAATLPLRIVAEYWTAPAFINGYSGTVWNGQAQLRGGHALEWRLDLPASLAAFGPSVDASLTGPGTNLAARITAFVPWRRGLRIDNLAGRAGWPLVTAFAPPLIVACDAAATLSGIGLATAPGRFQGEGRAAAGPGLCSRVDSEGAAPLPLPAIAARMETLDAGLRGVLTLAQAPDDPIADALLANEGRLVVTVYPAGAALVPGMPASGETTLEYPLPEWIW